MKIRVLALAFAALALSGCAPSWKMVRQNNASQAVSAQGYSVTLPQGWMTIAPGNKAITLVTHDGELLDFIRVGREDNDKALAAIKKAASPTELPADLATDFIAAAKTSTALSNLTVVKNEPVSFGGHDGFHLVMTFSNADGVRYQWETYGVRTENGFYSAIYRAPVLHYYDLYEKDFQATVASFKITK